MEKLWAFFPQVNNFYLSHYVCKLRSHTQMHRWSAPKLNKFLIPLIEKRLVFYSAFRWHCMSSSCCSCHFLCCMVQPNQTPPSTVVEQTCCVDFVRLSLLSWLSFTCVKKWIKWECKWLLMLRTQLKALRIIYIRWIKIGLLVPPLEKPLLLMEELVLNQLIIIPLVIFFSIFITCLLDIV